LQHRALEAKQVNHNMKSCSKTCSEYYKPKQNISALRCW